ncbi:uncharacterized protein CDAR_291691 [Caerostris darwini]|uniref:Uncharacterized protein n=1 Tax=Caerostris darwini TaxID=1538125 RepID=A0AAV4MW05_9ARAC|nr:uncharacterized protein CDAR_291691 [Caerostris darwini]
MELRFRNWKYLHTYLELKSSVSLGGGHASNGVVGIGIVCCRVSGQETALHWAAKHGDANVIKLIAGAYKVNPNIRSGYTPVHLAALYKHDMIVHLLVHTYGADDSIRDYSGKRADQYPDNYIRVVAGHKAAERRPLKQRPPEKEPTAPSSNSFMRIGSLNLRKARKSAVFASVRGGSRNRSSIGDIRFGSHASMRKKLHKSMPPLEKKSDLIEKKNDSDSDSNYGFPSKKHES